MALAMVSAAQVLVLESPFLWKIFVPSPANRAFAFASALKQTPRVIVDILTQKYRAAET